MVRRLQFIQKRIDYPRKKQSFVAAAVGAFVALSVAAAVGAFVAAAVGAFVAAAVGALVAADAVVSFTTMVVDAADESTAGVATAGSTGAEHT